MPLSEFLRMASGKVEAAEQKSTNCSADLSSLHEDGLAELVWNNDQVMIQSQSNRARKNPAINQFPSEAPGMRDNRYLGGGNRSNSKAAKFAAVQSLMDDDGAPSVPSAAILNQDNDIEPWLNAQAYISDPLPEISGVTANEPSLYGSFALMNKRNGDGKFGHSQNVPMNIRVNSELHNSSSATGLFNPYDSNQGELSVPLIGSRVSHFNSSTQNSNVLFGNSNQGQTSEKSFMSMLPEKHSLGTSGSGPQPQPQPQRVLNFTNFSRPAALYRSNLQKSDGGLDASCSSSGIKRTQNEDTVTSCIPIKSTNFQPSSTRKEMGSCNEINLVSTKADSGPSVVKSPVKLCSDEEPPDSVSLEDSIKNDKSHSCDAHIAKGFTVGDKTAEPLLAASSVCSGNSAEMASNDQTRKRKDRDNEESDSRSEDNEEESVGRKKAAPGRGVSGSKRSRAAEVHNLSERKRRDRINEKMRALQELIPNCNKADKASMLDEAIEYLKNLQLQVQVMSMGAGFCMPRMMFPTALPPMHAAHMPHFPQVGGGMGFGMGMGFDMNSGVPRFPVFPMSTMQGARFSSPPMYGPSTYQGLAAGHNFQFFGLPAQGLPVSVPRAPPLFPSSGQPPISLTAGVSNTQQVGDAPKTYPVICSDASVQNKSLQPVSDACARTTMDRMPSQSEAVNGAFDHPLSIKKDDKVLDACGTTSVNLTNTKDDVYSKEGSH